MASAFMTGYIHPSSQRPETHVCVSSPLHGAGSTWGHAPVKFSVSTADRVPLTDTFFSLDNFFLQSGFSQA